MDPNLKFSLNDGDHIDNPFVYKRLIGRIMYLIISRPDITFAIHNLNQYMHIPLTTHLVVVHHLLQYLELRSRSLFPCEQLIPSFSIC